MYSRCSNPQHINCGYLQGFKLVFDGYSKNRSSLVADIREDENSKVPYVLWFVDEQDEKKLDYSEGYSKHYDKRVIEVDKDIKAIVYVMTEFKKEQRKREYYVSEDYENTIRKGYAENNLEQLYLDNALKETGNIVNKSFDLSITTALKRSGITKDVLANKLNLSIEEVNKLIKNYDSITFSKIVEIAEILDCSPSELIFTKITKRPKTFDEEKLSKYFHELYFAVDWIVSIFYEKLEYHKSNIDFHTNKQKSLFNSGSHYYALILIAELWNSANNEDDDISFNGFFNYSLNFLDEKFNGNILALKNKFNTFKKENKDLLSRFKLSRDKTIVHMTNYQRKLITIKDYNNIPVTMYETEFNIDELKLVINTLVEITNEIITIINELGHLSLTSIRIFDSDIYV